MNFKKAFTVVEVMLVVTIISVLSVVTISFVSLSRDRAKEAKVQQEKVLVKGVIEAYAAEHGGYPNPNRGGQGAALYCIGSEDCIVKGRRVDRYMDPTLEVTTTPGGFQLGDLISFSDEGVLSQGFVYSSCGGEEEFCTAENSGLIFPQSDDVWASYFDGSGDDYSFTFLGTTLDAFLELHDDEYPIITGGGGDNPDPTNYPNSCRESDYPEYYGAFGLGYCQASQNTSGKWYCSYTCQGVIDQYITCNPNQSGAFAISSNICSYAGSQSGEVVYCSGVSACQDVISQFGYQCNGGAWDMQNCYSDNGATWNCRDSSGCTTVCDPGDSWADCDNDGVSNGQDSCPGDYNEGVDQDGDGIDAVCDPNDAGVGDYDGDTWDDTVDNCYMDPNPGQEDVDLDNRGDVCDADPNDPNIQ